MRTLLALLLCLVSVAARAAPPAYPCPSFHAGVALTGPGPITNVMWDQYTQQLYIIWINTQVSTLVTCPLADQNGAQVLATETNLALASENPVCRGVSLENFASDYYPVPSSSVMQNFSQSKNWVQTFNTVVAPRYHAVELKEVDNCPVLQENFSFPCDLSVETGDQILATQTSIPLFTENPVCTTVPGSYIWVN